VPSETNQKPRLGVAWFALLSLAIFSGLLWRIEIEIRGWNGIAWVSYDHWAIPAGAAFYLCWVGIFAPVEQRGQRWLLLGLLLILGGIAGAVLGIAMPLFFVALSASESQTVAPPVVSLLLFPSAWLLIPVVLNFVGRVFVRTPRGRFLASTLLFLLAWPIAWTLLQAIPQPGPPDALHALKTGFVIPILFTARGIPFLPRQ